MKFLAQSYGSGISDSKDISVIETRPLNSYISSREHS